MPTWLLSNHLCSASAPVRRSPSSFRMAAAAASSRSSRPATSPDRWPVVISTLACIPEMYTAGRIKNPHSCRLSPWLFSLAVTRSAATKTHRC